VIFETGGWLVDHCIGPLGVGTLIVKPKRHVVHVADLEPDEAAELGPLLRRTSAVVAQLARAEQVYATLWSHMGGVPVHIHFVVQPVTRNLMDELGLHGPRLQVAMFDRGELPDPAEAASFAAQARGLF
jgi:diadenosine tetraphosphate (Ap4A) HIT family hydrolase